MIVGSHTHSHRVLSRLNYQEQLNELKISFEFLKDTFNLKDIVFCYPYGHTHTYNKDTIKILQNLDYHSAFNTLRDTTCITKADKYQLQRFDTVDLYPRKEII